MAQYQPANASTVASVLRRYADWLDKQDPEFREFAAEGLNGHLDELMRGDAFGTEGQCDPRGDHRE